MLTGKCKEAFEKWYSETHGSYENSLRYEEDLGEIYVCKVFMTLPLSFQYGVYVDFFDSVGINIILEDYILGWRYMINPLNKHKGQFKTRQEARKAAIEKANEIFNNK